MHGQPERGRASAASSTERAKAEPPRLTGPRSALASLRCPTVGKGHKLGRAENPELVEASGIVASRRNPTVLWSHNDSGRSPQLFAMTEDGRDLGTYRLAKSKVANWEDIAIGPAETPGEWYIYVGDIGETGKGRRQITVLRTIEPAVRPEQRPKARKIKAVTHFYFSYPDRGVHDAETLMVDPRSGDLYIVTKAVDTAPTVYRAKAPLVPDDTQVLEEVAKLGVFLQGGRRASLVTGGDISTDGSQILIRSYRSAFLWQRRDSEPLAESLGRAPCPVPLSDEKQGEAVAFSADGVSYFTVSEGDRPKIHRFDIRSPL